MAKLYRRTQDKLLRILRKLGLKKVIRECYKHSIQVEAAWRIKNRFCKDEQSVKKVEGSKISLRQFESGIEKDLWLHGVREHESTEILKSEISNGMNCVDIGANIGYYALLESKLVGETGEVLAIEPQPDIFDRLRSNINTNSVENVKPLNLAVTEENSDHEIKIGEEHNTTRLLANGEGKHKKNTKEVQGKCLETIIEKSPDLIRMDIQGFESNLIEQITNLETAHLKLFLEIHPGPMEKIYDTEPIQFWRKLSGNGFRIRYLIMHGDKPNISYFFRSEHPSREVVKVDKEVSKAIEEKLIPKDSGRGYRVFLER
jgi:FkbM family methyltransferase